MSVRLKRVYESAANADGYRVLVDRLWPRGITKDAARLSAWRKELAPSSELRKWFHHDLTKWEDFKERYFQELDDHREEVEELVRLAKERRVTLLFGAKDEEHNNAVALREYLERNFSA